MHWSEAYVGKIYIPNVYDCGHNTEEIQNDVFHRGVYLPARWDDDLSILTEQINDEQRNYAKQVDSPYEGDVILMKSISGNINHIGTVFFIGPTEYVIHNVKSIGSVVISKARDLKRFGFIPEGYYRWN